MTNVTIDATINPDETPTQAARKRSIAQLEGLIRIVDEMNNRLVEILREYEPWRYSGNKFKRGCSWLWRGIKGWLKHLMTGCFYIVSICLFLMVVHWMAQAGGKIAGLF